MSEIVSDVFGYPKLAFESIEQLLKFLFEQSQKEKLILVLDEYPYIRENVKGLDSILQALVDQYQYDSGMNRMGKIEEPWLFFQKRFCMCKS